MYNKRRSIYYADLAIFIILALPYINYFVIDAVLSFGNGGTEYKVQGFVPVFVGIAGVLGVGFSLIRIYSADSRSVVIVSMLVKLVAALWLLYGYLLTSSPLFIVLFFLDISSAVVFALDLNGRK